MSRFRYHELVGKRVIIEVDPAYTPLIGVVERKPNKFFEYWVIVEESTGTMIILKEFKSMTLVKEPEDSEEPRDSDVPEPTNPFELKLG